MVDGAGLETPVHPRLDAGRVVFAVVRADAPGSRGAAADDVVPRAGRTKRGVRGDVAAGGAADVLELVPVAVERRVVRGGFDAHGVGRAHGMVKRVAELVASHVVELRGRIPAQRVLVEIPVCQPDVRLVGVEVRVPEAELEPLVEHGIRLPEQPHHRFQRGESGVTASLVDVAVAVGLVVEQLEDHAESAGIRLLRPAPPSVVVPCVVRAVRRLQIHTAHPVFLQAHRRRSGQRPLAATRRVFARRVFPAVHSRLRRQWQIQKRRRQKIDHPAGRLRTVTHLARPFQNLHAAHPPYPRRVVRRRRRVRRRRHHDPVLHDRHLRTPPAIRAAQRYVREIPIAVLLAHVHTGHLLQHTVRICVRLPRNLLAAHYRRRPGNPRNFRRFPDHRHGRQIPRHFTRCARRRPRCLPPRLSPGDTT